MLVQRLTPRRHRRLLLMFCGWSTDASVAESLTYSGYDTIAVSDYRQEPADAAFAEGYDEIVVAAWSFGVAAASRFMAAHPYLPVTRRVAFNGTQHPVSDTLGIPADIFNGTVNNLNARNLVKFHRRMAAGMPFTPPADPDIEALRAELHAIASRPVPELDWDLAFIADDDRIIPAANQQRAWQGHAAMCHIEGGHLPPFNALLGPLMVDKDLVAERFGRAHATYDDAATVQRAIARKLLTLAPLDTSETIEIGSGTGLLTRELLERYSPGRLTLVDFHPEPFEGAVCVSADAELWIALCPDNSASAIISASTMQWFNSPKRFVDQVRRALRPGGTALLSTFGPATMRELNGLAPHLHYPEPADYGCDTLTELIEVHFDSSTELLRHMSHTGVNAIVPSNPSAALRIARRMPRNADGTYTLTYQPVYIIIHK